MCGSAEIVASEVVAEVGIVTEGVGAVCASAEGTVVAEVWLSAGEAYWADWVDIVEWR